MTDDKQIVNEYTHKVSAVIDSEKINAQIFGWTMICLFVNVLTRILDSFSKTIAIYWFLPSASHPNLAEYRLSILRPHDTLVALAIDIEKREYGVRCTLATQQ